MFNNSNLIFGIKKERDLIFSQLEDDVFSKLKELTKDDIPVKSTITPSFVSFEDAIKELVELKNKNFNQ